MPSSQPGSVTIGLAEPTAERASQECRDDELLALCRQLEHLLIFFDSHDIAGELQRLHNAQPAEARQGYRMEITMLSPSYQRGGYDPSF